MISATLPKTLCRSFLGPRTWGIAACIVLDVDGVELLDSMDLNSSKMIVVSIVGIREMWFYTMSEYTSL